MTGNDLVRAGAARLNAAGIPDAIRDARRLLAHILESAAPDFSAQVAAAQAGAYGKMIAERATFRPVSQIIGWREFWGRRFRVTPDVLDPRPETETLVELALLAPPPQHILDLGTGSGILAITLLAEWPQAQAVATDISGKALAIAAENARTHGVGARLALVQSDWLANVPAQYDLIVSNPPYIAESEMASLAPDVLRWEPHIALTAGGDGLAAYRAIIAGLTRHLLPKGRVLLETGYRQAETIGAMLKATNLGPVQLHRDLNGHLRVAEMQRHGR